MSGHINKKEIDEIWSTLNNSKQEIEEGYFGKILVYESEKYTPNQIVYSNNTAGTRTFSLLTSGYYQVSIVGAGGGGAGGLKGASLIGYGSFNLGAGGSGSCIKIICKLRKNNNYDYTLGAGGAGYSGRNSHNGGAGGTGGATVFYGFSANGGGGGTCTGGGNRATGGSGGKGQVIGDIPSIVYDCSSINGNAGGTRISNSPAYPGTSVYKGYGGGGRAYGKIGSGSFGDAGGTGGIEVIYLGKRYSPSLKTLTININVPATVKINGEVVAEDVTTYSTSMYYNDSITWEVSADGYVTQSDTYVYTSFSNTATINITLEPDE